MTRKKPVLFDWYPSLEDAIPWTSLGTFPTPIQEMTELESSLGHQSLWIKRDDLSGELYGGNKVRKLEFVLGDALKRKKRWILTFGGLGTNHGLATAIYGREKGLKAVLALIDQPVTPHVQNQLMLFDHYEAKITYAKNTLGAVVKGLWQLLTKRGVYFLGPGGSSELGNLGFIDAALELARQIEEGVTPTPRRIYVALGSMGTFTGLYLGLKFANLDTELVGVRVTDIGMTNEKKTSNMINQTARYLASFSDEIPIISVTPKDVIINHEYAGPCYGSVTEKGTDGLRVLKVTEGIELETTYTAKAFACMVDDVKSGSLEDEPILFWNTYNSVDLSPIARQHGDYTKLPKSFHRFFS
ncbi:MAG: 1-aminocyclopropane-1-carboxylate deaminase/D-cysteine desulfhydrase [Candidatus Thorarchaeota archaeon]